MRRLWKIRLFALIGRPRCGACGDHRATTTRNVDTKRHPEPPVLDADEVDTWTWRLCGKCAAWVDARWSHLITDSKEATR